MSDDIPKQTESDISRCLVPLLDALGWRGDHSALSAALPHLPKEMGIEELLNTMANLRFEGRIFETNISEIDSRLLPCLFIQKNNKAEILLASGNGNSLVFDGSLGEYRQIPATRGNGKAVIFKAMNKGADSFLRRQPRWIDKALGRFSGIFFQSTVITFFISLLALAPPLFVMTIFDTAIPARSVETLLYLGIGFLLFILADVGFRFLRAYQFRYISVRLGNIIGNEVLRRILYLPPSFTETANISAQISRIKDFDSVRDFFGGQAVISIFELPFIIVLIGALAAIGGVIAMVPIAAIAIFVVFGLTMLSLTRRVNAVTAEAGTKRQSFIVEMLNSLEAIKFTHRTGVWIDRYRDLSAEASMANFNSARLNGLINSLSSFLVMTAGLATMAVGVLEVIGGRMTAGALMASMMLTWRVLAPLRAGFGILTQLGRIQKSLSQVNRLMNMRMENDQNAELTNFARLKGMIDFSNVSIRYATDTPPALVGVNFHVEPGEMVAIIGHDGAGKSTILKLMLGLYKPQAGRVLMDGANIQQLDPVLLRGNIGYAPKINSLFYGTIAQNLRLVNAEASNQELENAALKAKILEDILEMPDGFDTRIGDHNISLFSPSLARKLCLARVYLRRPKLMLFDEPEDGLTYMELTEFLEELVKEKGETTIIVATHNTSVLPLADKVIWMEGGRIKMAGPANEVGGAYRTEVG